MKWTLNWDKAGIAASILCAIHCAVLPILPATISLMGISITENPWFEWGMIILTLLIGVYALWHGYHTHHRNPAPLLFFGFGFLCLILKQIFHDSHLIFLGIAVIAIIYAHLRNFRLCRQSKCSSAHHSH